MPKALKLTETNVDRIVRDAKLLGFDLSHLNDEIICNTEDGFATILVTDGGERSTKNITYTALTDAGFHQSWKFTNAPVEDQFAEIERI